MKKVILITGATDGIGLLTAKKLHALGHVVLLHGRNQQKLSELEQHLAASGDSENVASFVADLSKMSEVDALAQAILKKYSTLDVVINNAGVFNIAQPLTVDNLDARFAVNTLAPYLLTKKLLPALSEQGRVVNLSSAAQSEVDLAALAGQKKLPDNLAYAQSKLAITMWSYDLAQSLQETGPAIIAVNPKSLLGSKMVKQAYGIAGGDLSIGADILHRAALSQEFADASGKYFDNDIGQFAAPHPDAQDLQKCREITLNLEKLLKELAIDGF